MFIYLNGYIEKTILKALNQRASLSFLQKRVLGGILILVSQVREVNIIFKTICDMVVFVRNLGGGK